MLAVLATGAPATGSPSIAKSPLQKRTCKTSDSHLEGPPLLDVFTVCVDSATGNSRQFSSRVEGKLPWLLIQLRICQDLQRLSIE